MIVETGEVVGIDGSYVLVTADRSAACGRCAGSTGCGAAVLSRLAGRRRNRIRVLNRHRAGVGDTVTLGMSEAGLLKSAALVYVVPLLAIAAAIVLGTAVFDAPLSEPAAIGLGAGGFLAGLVFARWFARRTADSPDYHPVMLSARPFARDRTVPYGGRGTLAP